VSGDEPARRERAAATMAWGKINMMDNAGLRLRAALVAIDEMGAV
jgi:hypothetical protein